MSITVGTCSIAINAGPGAPCVMTGSSNPPTLVGSVLSSFALDVKITGSGPLGVALYSWRLNAGAWSTPETTRDPNVVYQGTTLSLGPTGRDNPAGGSIGLVARFVEATYTAGAQWSFTLATQPGAPTVSGSGAAEQLGAALMAEEFVRLLEDRSGCPLPDPDNDNSSDISAWLAFAQRRFDAMAARCVNLATVFAGWIP
jgi:hypothetical protein